jgi:hypothetical protein
MSALTLVLLTDCASAPYKVHGQHSDSAFWSADVCAQALVQAQVWCRGGLAQAWRED